MRFKPKSAIPKLSGLRYPATAPHPVSLSHRPYHHLWFAYRSTLNCEFLKHVLVFVAPESGSVPLGTE